jgi:hypothetical protein
LVSFIKEKSFRVGIKIILMNGNYKIVSYKFINSKIQKMSDSNINMVEPPEVLLVKVSLLQS